MMRLASMLAASGEGKGPGSEGFDLSTTAIEHRAKASRRVRARAVLSPKTPEPTMRMEEGGENVLEEGEGEEGEEEEKAEAAEEDILGDGTVKWIPKLDKVSDAGVTRDEQGYMRIARTTEDWWQIVKW
jgi:hypothetical protein